MTRSSLHSSSLVLASALFCLSLSPLAGVAHADPGVGPAGQADNVDIIYGEADEGAIYVGPVTAPPRQTSVALEPGDVLYGDADQGAIEAAPAPKVAAPQQAELTDGDSPEDLAYVDDDMGAAPVD
jgi:hypothetical protein